MKKMAIFLVCLVSLSARAQILPEIYVTEVSLSNGGIYTLSINQPPSPPGEIWQMAAWGLVNNDAQFAVTGFTGWTAEVIDSTTWDGGLVFETGTPVGSIYLFESGIAGVSDFFSLFGNTTGQAVIYWNDSYIGNPLVATSSNFEWYDGTRNGVSRGLDPTPAFVYITSPTNGGQLCQIGVGSPVALDCVPAGPPDTDGDGVPDFIDNCTLAANPDQEDTDGDGYGNACDPDLNGDDIVNAIDLGLFKQRFFTTDADADFNSDGIVNAIDLGVIKALFFQPPGPAYGF